MQITPITCQELWFTGDISILTMVLQLIHNWQEHHLVAFLGKPFARYFGTSISCFHFFWGKQIGEDSNLNHLWASHNCCAIGFGTQNIIFFGAPFGDESEPREYIIKPCWIEEEWTSIPALLFLLWTHQTLT